MKTYKMINPKPIITLSKLNQLIEVNYSTAQKIILTDNNTLKLCLPLLLQKCKLLADALIITIPAGEIHKNENTAHLIWQQLADNYIDRNALLINLGGGMVCDIGGFCASTYKRGIDFINVPTTLMAMVDAANGGKTGMNLNGLKNFVGTFSLPITVAVVPLFLKTLDRRNVLSGYAEMIKHALVADAKLFKKFTSHPIKKNIMPENIFDAIKIKSAIVKKDPKEKNLRKLLNFGHTAGHAIESYSLANDNNPLFHGECVAMGILIESYLSYKTSGLKRTEIKAVAEYLDEVYVFPKLSELAINEIIVLMLHDKKNQNGNLNFTLLSKIGKGIIDCAVPSKMLNDAFLFYNDMAE